MKKRARVVGFLHRLLDVVVCGFFMAVIASGSSSLLLLATGLARVHSLIWIAFESLVFSLFTIANVWAGLLFFGSWIVFFTPATKLGWGLLLGASLFAGVLASWVLQASPLMPDDPSSMVGTPSVEMLSAMTYISCFATVMATSLVTHFIRRTKKANIPTDHEPKARGLRLLPVRRSAPGPQVVRATHPVHPYVNCPAGIHSQP